MSKLLLAIVVVFLFLRAGEHSGGRDRVALFSPIDINEGETAGDVACAFCTVNVHGDVHGDMAVLFGTVNANADRTITGDVAIFLGRLHLSENDHIGGDLAAALSTTDIPDSATISGDRAVLKSGVGIAVLAGPILILSGVIGLIIFLVRRRRYPYPI